MQSRYTQSRGNISSSSSREQFTSSVAFQLVSPRLPESSPESSVRFVAKLRSEGIRTVIYLDDLLLIHNRKDTLSEIFLYVRRLLSSLGFIVKLEKCSLEPTRRLVFLGAVLDTTCMSVALPEEQINRIQGACQVMLESQSTSLGELSSLLGRMSHATRTGLWVAPLY